MVGAAALLIWGGTEAWAEAVEQSMEARQYPVPFHLVAQLLWLGAGALLAVLVELGDSDRPQASTVGALLTASIVPLLLIAVFWLLTSVSLPSWLFPWAVGEPAQAAAAIASGLILTTAGIRAFRRR